MTRIFRYGLALGALALAVALTGCQTSTRGVYKFSPLAHPNVGDQNLAPIKSQSASDLLKAAGKAFTQANEAQEKGDSEAALRHYNKMLELLRQADLDPVIFYNLRNEFGRILQGTTQLAYQLENRELPNIAQIAYGDTAVMGDLPIPFPLPSVVEAEVARIQKGYQGNFQRGLNRSFKYAPRVRQMLTEKGLPQDLFWLMMVESQFWHTATSHAGAKGLWQFMTSTARLYGLRVDNYVDERMDWERASAASMEFLSDLYARFNDWGLAVSAYNCGEYGMMRAVAAAGGSPDIWTLIDSAAGKKALREETRQFYPKLCATIIVASNPEKYGFEVKPETPESYVRVPVKGQYSLASLAKAAGIPEEKMAALNADLYKGVTPPNSEHSVAVPIEANQRFIEALNTVPRISGGPEPMVVAEKSEPEPAKPGKTSPASIGGPSKGHTYTVKRGDRLATIAERFGLELDTLAKANGLRSSSRVPTGKVLKIPTAGAMEEAPTPAESATAATYKVVSGDTLSTIAAKIGVSLKDLAAWNNLGQDATILTGQTLTARPPSSTAPEGPKGEKITHVVAKGEFPAMIARKYNVRLADLQRWNSLGANASLKIGDKLTLYPDGAATIPTPKTDSTGDTAQAKAATEQPADSFKDITHKAVKGDSAGKIAAKYNVALTDFISWNKLGKNSVIQEGKSYTVKVPASEKVEAAASSDDEKAPISSGKTVHKAASGDSPSAIAAKYDIKIGDFRKWNGLGKDDVVIAGKEYRVAASTDGEAPVETARQAAPQPAVTPAASGKTYKVASGDSAARIAQKNGVNLDALLAANNLKMTSKLQVGQELVIPGKSTQAEESSPEPAAVKTETHTVISGDSPSKIAAKYKVKLDDLMAWNSWKKDKMLQVGEKVTIKK